MEEGPPYWPREEPRREYYRLGRIPRFIIRHGLEFLIAGGIIGGTVGFTYWRYQKVQPRHPPTTLPSQR